MLVDSQQVVPTNDTPAILFTTSMANTYLLFCNVLIVFHPYTYDAIYPPIYTPLPNSTWLHNMALGTPQVYDLVHSCG